MGENLAVSCDSGTPILTLEEVRFVKRKKLLGSVNVDNPFRLARSASLDLVQFRSLKVSFKRTISAPSVYNDDRLANAKYPKTCHQIHSLLAFFNKYLLQRKTNVCKPTSCVLLARVTRSSILLQGYT